MVKKIRAAFPEHKTEERVSYCVEEFNIERAQLWGIIFEN